MSLPKGQRGEGGELQVRGREGDAPVVARTTPQRLLVHMRDDDVKAIAKSKNIAASLESAAKQLEEKRRGSKPGQSK